MSTVLDEPVTSIFSVKEYAKAQLATCFMLVSCLA
jgi:hypothetical protein